MPHRRGVGADRHLEQRLDDVEQAFEHLGLGEVLFDLLIAEGVACFLELFAGVGHVPGLQIAQSELLARKVAQLGQIFFGVGARTSRQISQEVHHLLCRGRHLGHQRHLGVVLIAQQCRFFLAQAQQLAHHLGVVLLGSAQLAGSGRVGGVQPLAQGAFVAVLHDRKVAREMQRDLVPRLAFGLCCRQGSLARIIGHATHFFIAGVVRITVGGVEHVLGELLRQIGLQLLKPLEALLGLALQVGTGQHEVAHGIAERLGPRRAEPAAGGTLRDGLVLGIQPLVGRMPARLLADLGQRRGVGRAQLGRVGHRIEMPDGTPCAPESLVGGVEHGRHRVVIGAHIGADGPLECLVAGLEQLIDGRADMLRADLIEGWQAVGFKQWVGHGVSLS